MSSVSLGLYQDFSNMNQEEKSAVENFLQENYPIDIDWSNKEMSMLLLLKDNPRTIVGVLVMVNYENNTKVHICVIAVDARLRRKGFGTEMLKHVASINFGKEVTLNVTFDKSYLLRFYCDKGYAKLKMIDIENRIFVLSLLHLTFLARVPLP